MLAGIRFGFARGSSRGGRDEHSREAAGSQCNQALWVIAWSRAADRYRSPSFTAMLMAQGPQHSVTKRHVVGCALVALAFTAFGAVALLETLALHRSESVTVARVVESRTLTKQRGGVSFEVRYAFSPAPDSPEFGRSDFLGRTNLWSSLPEPDWQAAIATKQLKVRFDPNHPGNNAPDVSLPGSLGDSSTLLFLGIAFGVSAVCAEIARRRKSTVEV